jgi:large conductance mechanosensitive channel
MSLAKEFKEFISRGNVVDLAVGVIIGGAFGAIVNSLVKDIVMPPIGLLTSGVNFADKKLQLAPDTMVDGKTVPGAAIAYGDFLNTVISFLIISAVIFVVVKAVNSLKRHEAAKPTEPAAPTTDQKLLMEIRDLLANRQP